MTSASHVPTPKRRLSWRKLMLGLLAFVLAVAMAHLFWRAHEQRKFMADIERYRAAGEPVLPEDFARLQVSGPGDPVPEWLAAASAVNLPADATFDDLQFPLTDKESKFLADVVRTNQSALAHAKDASHLRGMPDWRLDYSVPVISMMLRHLKSARYLAHVLCAAAMEAHQRGDDAEAVERLSEAVAQRNALFQQPGLVAHLVAIGVGALACDTLEKIVPELRIGAEGSGPGRPASPLRTRQLIAKLLDEKPLRDGQRWALLGERMIEADSTTRLAAGTLDLTMYAEPLQSGSTSSSGTRFAGYVLGPMLYNDGRLCMEYMTGLLPVAQTPDYPTCQLQFQSVQSPGRLDRRVHLLAAILLPATNRVLLQDFRALTTTRLAATALAARWYADEHQGRFPDSLNDLVPNYLPAVPNDPMISAAPLRFRNGPQAIVYSVGEDGVDDGGSEQHLHGNRINDRWDQKDVVTHLTSQPRRPVEEQIEDDAPPADTQPAPLTQPVDIAPSTGSS